MNCAIGVDVGGTKILAALVAAPEGRILARRLLPTGADRGGEAVLTDVIRLVHELRREAAEQGVQPTAVGIGLPELVGLNGEVRSEATIHWRNLPVVERLQAETGLAAYLDADVRAAARAEAIAGAGRGHPSFLYVTVGTGISSSLVMDALPYAGARGLTGTFASSRGLIPDDYGQLVTGPSLEQYAAGPALAARLAAVRSGFTGTAKDVIALAESGGADARQIVETAGRALGAAIAHLVNVLDPEVVVVGGGLGLVAGRYRTSIDEALRAHVWSEHHRDIPLLSAQFGEDAGVIGAAFPALGP